MSLRTWEELTQQTIDRIQAIFKSSPTPFSTDQRLKAYALAHDFIRHQRFDTPSAMWGAFINALRIVVATSAG
jgi:hypothetical protein